jgi:hypothetical protein
MVFVAISANSIRWHSLHFKAAVRDSDSGEDWKTVTLEGTSCELSDETSTAAQRFYRAIEDNSAVADEP